MEGNKVRPQKRPTRTRPKMARLLAAAFVVYRFDLDKKLACDNDGNLSESTVA